MKKKDNSELEVIYLGEDEIIIEEDNRKKYPFMIFFFKYGRLLTMLFATISILTFIGGIALSLSSIPKITPPSETTPTKTVMEFDGTDNKIDFGDKTPIKKDYAEKLFDNNGSKKNNSYMKVSNIITVGNDKVIYFDNGAAVIIYGDRNKLPIYVPNSNNVDIDKKTNTIKVTGDTVKTAKKTILPDGMIVYDFENDKLMTEFNDDYKLYNKNNGNPINTIDVGKDKIVYFDNGAAVVIYDGNKMPDYVEEMGNVKTDNNTITINGKKETATDKKTLPDGTTVYDFPNNKSLHENKDKDKYKLYDTDKIIYDKDGNVKEPDTKNDSLNNGSPNKEEEVGKDKVLYFDNGSAVIIYADKNKLPDYIPNKNDVKTDNIPVVIDGDKVPTIEKKVLPDGTIIYDFDNDKALIEKDGEYRLVDKNDIEYDSDGNLKDDSDNDLSFKEFTIKNNGNEKITYRLVIEETDNYAGKAILDPQYIYQKVSINGDKKESQLLNKNPWSIGSNLEENQKIDKTTYILYEGEIDANKTQKVKLALWTDYDTIPNTMQDKWFIGTIKLYSWK